MPRTFLNSLGFPKKRSSFQRLAFTPRRFGAWSGVSYSTKAQFWPLFDFPVMMKVWDAPETGGNEETPLDIPTGNDWMYWKKNPVK